MFSIPRPYAFLFLLPLIPAWAFLFVRFRRLLLSVGSLYGGAGNPVEIRRLKRALWGKTLLRGACWIFLVLALSGLSWGKKTVFVQKNGTAVALVFDISYSMNAPDAGGGMTRLEAARRYAMALLDAMRSPSVAVVLAKGDGVLAVPLTEDRAAVQSLLDALSPELMTAAGSSIGRGIQTAIHAFPHQMGQAAQVWVFTDGDETDGSLQAALDDAVRFGIPVTLIGFGSAQGADVTAGDGKTQVHTALQSQALLAAAHKANEKSVLPKRAGDVVQYVQATASGSAAQLLRSHNATTYAYEVQTIDRHGLFLALALICFIVSFIVGEADVSPFSLRGKSAVLLVAVPLLFSSCNARGNASILKGAWAWYQKNYQQATAIFLQTDQAAQAEQDEVLAQYALFGLSATYLAQEEYDAALSRLEQIAPDAPAPIKSAAFYNQGIIAHKNGEYARAIALFKEAILSDPANTNAKINLELSQTEASLRQANGAEKEMQQAGEDKDDTTLEKGIFTLIKENEQNQWKRLQASSHDAGGVDY